MSFYESPHPGLAKEQEEKAESLELRIEEHLKELQVLEKELERVRVMASFYRGEAEGKIKLAVYLVKSEIDFYKENQNMACDYIALTHILELLT